MVSNKKNFSVSLFFLFAAVLLVLPDVPRALKKNLSNFRKRCSAGREI